MPFGQLVVGPPGSGKSTYCNGMQQYLSALGRKVAVINLDPANDAVSYDCAVDIMDLVSLEEVMRETKLGPNGGECCLAVLLLNLWCKLVQSWCKNCTRYIEEVSEMNICFCRPGVLHGLPAEQR